MFYLCSIEEIIEDVVDTVEIVSKEKEGGANIFKITISTPLQDIAGLVMNVNISKTSIITL